MNPAQTALYFREWGKVRAYHVTRGIDPKQADAKRHELHRKALGFDKSSKDFTNADLDKVLAVFWAITKPADLNAQLRQQDQADNRRADAERDCRNAIWEMYQLGENGLAQSDRRDRYLESIARNVCHKSFDECNGVELRRVHGVLLQRIKQLQRNRPGRPGSLQKEAAKAAKNDPF